MAIDQAAQNPANPRQPFKQALMLDDREKFASESH